MELVYARILGVSLLLSLCGVGLIPCGQSLSVSVKFFFSADDNFCQVDESQVLPRKFILKSCKAKFKADGVTSCASNRILHLGKPNDVLSCLCTVASLRVLPFAMFSTSKPTSLFEGGYSLVRAGPRLAA